MVMSSLTFAQPPHVLWSTTFGGENNDYGYSVQETEDNGFILISKTESYGNGDNDVWLIKTYSNGNASYKGPTRLIME